MNGFHRILRGLPRTEAKAEHRDWPCRIGFSCASVTALLVNYPGPFTCGPFFFTNCGLGSTRWSNGRIDPPARGSVVKKVHVKELAKEKTPPKRGQVVHMSAYEA
jgi:hypothetical protein